MLISMTLFRRNLQLIILLITCILVLLDIIELFAETLDLRVLELELEFIRHGWITNKLSLDDVVAFIPFLKRLEDALADCLVVEVLKEVRNQLANFWFLKQDPRDLARVAMYALTYC